MAPIRLRLLIIPKSEVPNSLNILCGLFINPNLFKLTSPYSPSYLRLGSLRSGAQPVWETEYSVPGKSVEGE